MPRKSNTKPLEYHQNIGVAIRNLRHLKKMTLEDLAIPTGITISTISKIERAKKGYAAADSVLEDIASVLGTTVRDIKTQALGGGNSVIGILQVESMPSLKNIPNFLQASMAVLLYNDLAKFLDDLRENIFSLGIVSTTISGYSPFEFCKVARLFNAADIIVLRKRKDVIKAMKIVEPVVNSIIGASDDASRLHPDSYMFFAEWILF